MELDLMERPKTPQGPEIPPVRESNIPSVLPFPFFPPFPGPGLIPPPMAHPMFSRFGLPLPKGIPTPHPGIPNIPIPPRFLNPPIRPDDYSLSKPKNLDREKSTVPPFMDVIPTVKLDKVEKSDKVSKPIKQEKELATPIPVPVDPLPVMNLPPVVSTTVLPVAVPSLPIKQAKIDKTDKNDKVRTYFNHLI